MSSAVKADPSSYKPLPFCLNIKSISLHPLLLMNIILDFIFIGFAELWATGSKRKTQNENICIRRESNQRPLAFQRTALTTRLSGQFTETFYTIFLRYFRSTRVAMHVWNWFWLDVYWNWLSDKICISFTSTDVIYYYFQNLVWTNRTIINFILALSHELIDSRVKVV